MRLDDKKIYNIWINLQTLVVFGLFVYFSIYYFAPNYFGRLYSLVHIALPPVLVICYVFFSRLKDCVDIKLYFLFCLTISLIQIIDGRLNQEIDYVIFFGRWMCLNYLGIAFLLSEERRLKMLDIVSIIVCLAYVILGFACIYTGLSDEILLHPLTGKTMCQMISGRLYVFGTNCNSVSGWYYMVIFLLVYLIFRFKKTWQKALSGLGIIIAYICLSITFGRSAMVSFSVSIGMLAAAIALKHMKQKKTVQKAIALVLALCFFIPLSYKSFEVTTSAFTNISDLFFEKEEITKIQAENIASGVEIQNEYDTRTDALNDRGLSSSGRTKLWLASIECLRESPIRILIGSDKATEITNNYIKAHYPDEFVQYGFRPNHHNTYLDLFLEAGLVCFILILAFFVMLVIKMIKLFFSPETHLSVKTLVITLTGIMLYNLFESTLFYIYDMRTVIFCVLASYVFAYEKELPKKSVHNSSM